MYNILSCCARTRRSFTEYCNQTRHGVRNLQHTALLVYKTLIGLEQGRIRREDGLALVELDVLMVALTEAALAVSQLGTCLADADTHMLEEKAMD